MAGADSFSAELGALAQIPNMLNEARAGILALKSVVNVPGAASATGNPLVSAAIIALGAELLIFTYQCGEALADDIEGLQKTIEKYGDTEAAVTQSAQSGAARLATSGGPR